MDNRVSNKTVPTEEQRGRGVGMERLRKITGYLAYTNTWNDSKKAELRDRVKNI
jgi:anaerobic ribonucleoside-triphosphate reductase